MVFREIETPLWRKLAIFETEDKKRQKRAIPRVWVVDEAAIYDDNVVSRSYNPISTTPYINWPNNHRKDTIVVCETSDGTKIPIFFLNTN